MKSGETDLLFLAWFDICPFAIWFHFPCENRFSVESKDRGNLNFDVVLRSRGSFLVGLCRHGDEAADGDDQSPGNGHDCSPWVDGWRLSSWLSLTRVASEVGDWIGSGRDNDFELHCITSFLKAESLVG